MKKIFVVIILLAIGSETSAKEDCIKKKYSDLYFNIKPIIYNIKLSQFDNEKKIRTFFLSKDYDLKKNNTIINKLNEARILVQSLNGLTPKKSGGYSSLLQLSFSQFSELAGIKDIKGQKNIYNQLSVKDILNYQISYKKGMGKSAQTLLNIKNKINRISKDIIDNYKYGAWCGSYGNKMEDGNTFERSDYKQRCLERKFLQNSECIFANYCDFKDGKCLNSKNGCYMDLTDKICMIHDRCYILARNETKVNTKIKFSEIQFLCDERMIEQFEDIRLKRKHNANSLIMEFAIGVKRLKKIRLK